MSLFKNRIDAANKLAAKLREFESQKDVIVVGLARGGVVLASILSKSLNLPVEIICPKKIAHPMNPEYGVGAVTEFGDVVLDELAAKAILLSPVQLEVIRSVKLKEAQEKALRLKGSLSNPKWENKTILLVDDGLATGLTMMASIKAAHRLKAKRVIAAVPVAAAQSIEKIKRECESLIALAIDPEFSAVGQFYEDFSEVTDEDVIDLIKKIS